MNTRLVKIFEEKVWDSNKQGFTTFEGYINNWCKKHKIISCLPTGIGDRYIQICILYETQ